MSRKTYPIGAGVFLALALFAAVLLVLNAINGHTAGTVWSTVAMVCLLESAGVTYASRRASRCPAGPARTGGISDLLDGLEAAAKAATPGPWTAATAPAEGSDDTHAEYLIGALRPDEGRPLWVAWAPVVEGVHTDSDYVVPVVTGDGPTSEANARFVALAHDAAPRLTAALRAVLAAIDELDGWRDNAERRVSAGFHNDYDAGMAIAYTSAADRIRDALEES